MNINNRIERLTFERNEIMKKIQKKKRKVEKIDLEIDALRTNQDQSTSIRFH